MAVVVKELNYNQNVANLVAKMRSERNILIGTRHGAGVLGFAIISRSNNGSWKYVVLSSEKFSEFVKNYYEVIVSNSDKEWDINGFKTFDINVFKNVDIAFIKVTKTSGIRALVKSDEAYKLEDVLKSGKNVFWTFGGVTSNDIFCFDTSSGFVNFSGRAMELDFNTLFNSNFYKISEKVSDNLVVTSP